MLVKVKSAHVLQSMDLVKGGKLLLKVSKIHWKRLKLLWAGTRRRQ